MAISLKRAGAEFVVIAAGVLVALVADEWRADLADASLAEEYRGRLIRDLRVDTAAWRGIDRGSTGKVAALDRALGWLDDPVMDEVAVASFLDDLTAGARLSFGAGTAASQATYDEMVSSGRLHLVRDTATRRALIDYYRFVDLQRVRLQARETRYAPLIYELIPRDPEFVVRSDLSAAEAKDIAELAITLDIGRVVTAERNRGRLRSEVAVRLLEEARGVLVALDGGGPNRSD